METATVSQATENKTSGDKDLQRVQAPAPKTGAAVTQPEEVRADAQNPTVGNLETAIKDALTEMKHCDEQATLWLERKRQLQTKMNETLESIQKQFSNGRTEPEKKTAPAATRTRYPKDASVPDLIRAFLEKNGPQRSKDIRKFLLEHGRKTNPGVALSRMLKSGDLKSTERGIYKIA